MLNKSPGLWPIGVWNPGLDSSKSLISVFRIYFFDTKSSDVVLVGGSGHLTSPVSLPPISRRSRVDRCKTEKQSPGPSFFRGRFFDSFFNRFLMGSGSPNPPQMGPKSTKNRRDNALRRWLVFFIVFWQGFVPKPDVPNPKNIEKLLCFIPFKRLRRFRVEVQFAFDLAPHLASFWDQNWSKIHPQSH